MTTPQSLILLAEDDEDFLLIIKLALEQIRCAVPLGTVRNPRDLMRHLRERAIPSVIILDFYVAPNDWRFTLKDENMQKRLRRIPIVVLCSSDDREDIEICEKFKSCTYRQKPSSFEGWTECMNDILREYASM